MVACIYHILHWQEHTLSRGMCFSFKDNKLTISAYSHNDYIIKDEFNCILLITIKHSTLHSVPSRQVLILSTSDSKYKFDVRFKVLTDSGLIDFGG